MSQFLTASFIASIIIGSLWSFIGLILIFFLSTVTKSATIINTYHSFDGGYVIYEFEYDYLDKSYVGNSKERLGYSGQEYHVGDTLEIYVYSYDGSKYELSSNARYILVVILFMMVPYSKLSEEDKEKDAFAWEMLAGVADRTAERQEG